MKKTRWLSPLVRRLALREWLALFVSLLLMALVLGAQNGLGRLDQTLYDQFASANGRPSRNDIIIVAIDDYSLAELGRWPWPRTLHADLLRQIANANPRAIGLDVILSEPERATDGDQKLAQAIAENRRTVLPVVPANAGLGITAGQPVPVLTQAAAALGHINLEHDSDGVVRSVFLREGMNDVWWPHFATALAGAAGRPPASALTQQQSNARSTGWQRAGLLHIAYSGNSGHFRSVPYVSALRGEVPAEFFRDKYVLIGATAAGMTDSYPTPVSGQSGAMPGIEINANILAGLLDGKSIAIAPAWQTALFSVVPVLVALLAYFWFSPRVALAINLALVPLTLAVSYAALRAGIWIAPSAALIALIVSYPLWSWRRLEAAIAYLGQEFIRLDQEPHLLPEARTEETPDQIEDILDRRINAMKNAARRVRDLRQFVSDSLDNLPDASVVTDTAGRILLANKHATRLFASIGMPSLDNISVFDLFAKLKSPQPLDHAAGGTFDWATLLDEPQAAGLASGVGVRDEQGRDLLVKSAPCHSAGNLLTGWIVTVIDISTIRAAERSRDETLRFLSHDMRAPQASILALLELQSEPASALSQFEFFSRIEKASRKTLGLADNFVQLARAESQEYRWEEVDFQDLLFDATDEMWTLAKGKRITLVTDVAADDYPVRTDRVLMTRALTNLLSNAINYSPEDTRIVCAVRLQRNFHVPRIVCTISDRGYGIAPADQGRLFQRFQRVDLPNQPRHDGIGLGLVFVKTVVERHLGEISFTSKVGEGTTFTLVLPCHQEQSA